MNAGVHREQHAVQQQARQQHARHGLQLPLHKDGRAQKHHGQESRRNAQQAIPQQLDIPAAVQQSHAHLRCRRMLVENDDRPGIAQSWQ